MERERELQRLYWRIAHIEQCIEGCNDPSRPATSGADKVQIQQMLERTLLNLKLRAEALEQSIIISTTTCDNGDQIANWK